MALLLALARAAPPASASEAWRAEFAAVQRAAVALAVEAIPTALASGELSLRSAQRHQATLRAMVGVTKTVSAGDKLCQSRETAGILRDSATEGR